MFMCFLRRGKEGQSGTEHVLLCVRGKEERRGEREVRAFCRQRVAYGSAYRLLSARGKAAQPKTCTLCVGASEELAANSTILLSTLGMWAGDGQARRLDPSESNFPETAESGAAGGPIGIRLPQDPTVPD